MSIKKLLIILSIITGILLAGCSQQVNNGTLQTQAPVTTAKNNITTTAQGTDDTNYDYSSFKGQWYSPDVNLITTPYQIELTFNEDKKTAEIHITAYSQNSQNIEENYTVTFDKSGRGKLNEISDTNNNEIILSKDKRVINLNAANTAVPIGTQFLRQSDIDNIIKCMNIVAEKEGIADWRVRNNSEDENAVYIRYEGKNDDGRYQIAVRFSKGTVIKYWYYIDPVTYKYEIIR